MKTVYILGEIDGSGSILRVLGAHQYSDIARAKGNDYVARHVEATGLIIEEHIVDKGPTGHFVEWHRRFDWPPDFSVREDGD